MNWRAKSRRCARKSAAFTLVELMIVCAIIGAVLTIAIPTIYRYFHPESLEGTVRTFMEALSHARARAILNGTPTDLVIRPGDRTFEVSQSSAPAPATTPDRLESHNVAGEEWRMAERDSSSGTRSTGGGEGSGVFSGRIAEKILIEMLDVNFFEYKDAEVARVRFYPNGTSDEFTIVLRGENEQWRKITLEVVTGLPDLSSDPSKWMNR
ncbi:MAG TPA: GspH/FimT family pseudopilin [Verrucomicrobiae bacterium]|nr:GspH/FimT family pseudopilin [Verrucomicrobiae bacterium]